MKIDDLEKDLIVMLASVIAIKETIITKELEKEYVEKFKSILSDLDYTLSSSPILNKTHFRFGKLF